MSKLIELKGTFFGCWKILERSKSRILNCGTMRSFWICECLTCGSEFEESTKNIRRKLCFPTHCIHCAPGKKERPDKKKATHYSKIYCAARSMYTTDITDDALVVDCNICLKIMR